MDKIVYLCMGAGRHVDENRFSIASAARHLPADASWGITVYTNRAESFADLPVDIRLVGEAEAHDWRGRHDYVYRSTILALADALTAQGAERAAIVDGDTYFKRSPAELLAKIHPGTTLLHVREGRPGPPELEALRQTIAKVDLSDTSGRSWDLRRDETMWNAGVVGLHRSDRQLCEEVLHLTDELLDSGFAALSHTAEQLAWVVAFNRRSTMRECFDVVAHYWPADLREPFDERLRQVWSNPSLSAEEGFDALWRHRPRPGLVRRGKFVAKRLATRMGVGS
jgi:hypothetical protein